MKQRIGKVAFFMGLLVMAGVAGGITELQAEATWRDWFTLTGIAFSGGLLAQMGVWMINEEI